MNSLNHIYRYITSIVRTNSYWRVNCAVSAGVNGINGCRRQFSDWAMHNLVRRVVLRSGFNRVSGPSFMRVTLLWPLLGSCLYPASSKSRPEKGAALCCSFLHHRSGRWAPAVGEHHHREEKRHWAGALCQLGGQVLLDLWPRGSILILECLWDTQE